MELQHSFSVPTSVEETWAHFSDIEGVAQCFPGATVTSVEGDTFKGTAKVKLGPIALVYSGSGTFVERDEAAHRMLIEAKGKDKRGNGTAGATVTMTMSEGDGGSTDVSVATDLNITGKPAQFGRGVMQDVSDKLLGQFVECLGRQLALPAEASEDTPEQSAAITPAAPAAGAEVPPEASAAPPESAGEQPPPSSPPPPPARPAAPHPAESQGDDAIDLGATLLPVLIKSYGKYVAAALAAVVLIRWVVRRR